MRPSYIATAFATIFTLGLPAAAQECPTLADLDRGVVLEVQEPYFRGIWTRQDEHLNLRASNDPRAKTNDPEAQWHRSDFAHALTPMSWGGGYSMQYNRSTSNLRIEVGAPEWKSDFIMRRKAKNDLPGILTITPDGADTISVGSCNYPVIWTRVAMEIVGAEIIRERKAYAPSLGLVLVVEKLDPDGKVTSRTAVDRISAKVETASP